MKSVVVTVNLGGRKNFILRRMEDGRYEKLAILWAAITTKEFYQIARACAGTNEPFVDLGMLEDGEFVSEIVGQPFVSEVQKIISICC